MPTHYFGPLPENDSNFDQLLIWLGQQTIAFDKIIAGSLQVDTDIESSNWNGASPANLATIDAATSAGFYIDSSVGAAQFTGDMFIGGPGGDYLFLDATNWGTTTGIKWFRNSLEVARLFASDTNFFIQNVKSGGGDIELRAKVGDTAYGTVISGGLEISGGFIATLRGTEVVPAYHFGGGSDNDTGMFSPGANEVSLSAGATERLSVLNQSDSIKIHVDGALQLITAGATDSGGSGFKLLRVPN